MKYTDKIREILYGPDSQNQKSVAAPAAASVVLGGAYGTSKYIDDKLALHGWSRDNGFNKKTMESLNAYLRQKPKGNDFGLQYIDKTYKALSSPLFERNNQKVYEVLLNGSPEINAIKATAKDIRKSYLVRLIDRISNNFASRKIKDMAEAGLSSINEQASRPGASMAELTHMPAMGTSFRDAYLRGLSETKLTASKAMKLPSTVGERADMLASALFDELPQGIADRKSFFNYLLQNNSDIGIPGQPGKFKALRNAYDGAYDLALRLTQSAKTKEEAASILVAAMGGDRKKNIMSVVEDLVGESAKWKRTPAGNIAEVRPSRGGEIFVKSIDDAKAAARNSLALQLAHGDMSRVFSTAMGHHAFQIKAPQAVPVLRSPAVRHLAGASALGLAGISAYNYASNVNRKKRSILSRISKLFNT